MKSIKNKKVACVLLNSEGVPVTLSVASASDVRLPKVKGEEHSGRTFYVQQIDKLCMVSGDVQGKWICLMGELSKERLMMIAAALKF